MRPLAEKTLRRIAHGIMKFVVDNPRPFIVRYKYDNEPEDSNEPLSTVTTVNSHYLAMPSLIQYHSERSENVRGQGIDKPIMTVDASNRYGLVEPFLVQSGYGEREGHKPRVMDVQKPLGTVVAHSNKFAECSVFISKYYGGDNMASGADKPLPTVTAIDHNAMCAAFVTQFNNNSIGQEVSDPLNTITAGQGHFGDVRAFLVKYYSGNGCGSSCGDPAPRATRNHALQPAR